MSRSVARGLLLILLVLIAMILLVVYAPSRKTSKTYGPNNDPWKLVSYDPDNPYGTYLGNGYISCRIMGEGLGNHKSQSLPCYMAGLYDNEKLIPTLSWSDLRVYSGKNEFVIDKNAYYKQTLNLKHGILTTEATWHAGNDSLKGKVYILVSRNLPNVGFIKAEFTPSYNGIIDVKVVGLDKPPVVAKSTGIFVGTYHKLECISSKFKKIGEYGIQINAVEGKKVEVIYIVVLTTGSSAESARNAAVSIFNRNSLNNDYSRIIKGHKAAWEKIWKRDIVVDGPRKDQQAIHSCMFYLLQSVREGSQWSIPPMGLSSNNPYSGHIFWDADIWMFPALILQHPELAKPIVDYRYNTLKGAYKNAKASGYAGAEYAWESGYTGLEDTPQGLVYRHERHINGDVALAQWQYYLATGDIKWLKTRGYPVIKATADYWVSRVKLINGRYEIHNVVPPDENAELVNNSAYTNCIAQINLQIAAEAARRIGEVPNPKWQEVANKIYIPIDTKRKRFIAFDNHADRWVAKQADTELLIYPLQYKIPGQDMTDIYKNTFNYYSKRVHKNPPAMVSSAYSVIAARLGMRKRAYEEFVKSYKPYFRGPFNYFNEKSSKTYEAMCFVTGAAGPIQAIMFGLAGFRMEYFPADESPGFTIKPCLPKQWRSIRLKGLQWRGKTFDVVIKKGDKAYIEPASD